MIEKRKFPFIEFIIVIIAILAGIRFMWIAGSQPLIIGRSCSNDSYNWEAVESIPVIRKNANGNPCAGFKYGAVITTTDGGVSKKKEMYEIK